EMDRFAETANRLDAVEHHAAGAADEVLIKESGSTAEYSGEVRLPLVPLVGIDIGPGHAPPGAIHRMEVIADRPLEVPGRRKIGTRRHWKLGKLPAEEARGVVAVALRITPAGQVAHDAAATLDGQAGIRPPQSKLRLADARRTGDHSERPGKQPSSQLAVQCVNSK